MNVCLYIDVDVDVHLYIYALIHVHTFLNNWNTVLGLVVVLLSREI